MIQVLRVVAPSRVDLLREVLMLSPENFEGTGMVTTCPATWRGSPLILPANSLPVPSLRSTPAGHARRLRAVLEMFGREIKQVLDDHADGLHETMHQHYLKHVSRSAAGSESRLRTPS